MKAHPAAELFPMLPEAELRELAEDIKANGQRFPIVVWRGRDLIVDGRNRWQACALAMVGPRVELRDFADDAEAARYVVSVNLKRRHLDESQRAMLGARLVELYEAAAKARQVAALKQGDSAPVRANLPQREEASARAREDAARDVSVSPRSVQTAKKVLTEGAPELIAAVDAGKVAVSTAAAIVEAPKEKQAEIVAKGEKEILQKAKEIKAQKAEERRQERVEKLVEISRGDTPLLAPVRFPVVYADPPWSYDQHQDSNRGVNNHYPTMSLDAIKALPLGDITTPDAILYLWAVSPLLPEALEVIKAWGFTYKASWVWDKEMPGMGFYGRIEHELVLIATKGSIPTPPPAARPRSVFHIPRGEHSAKPAEFRQAIERCYPELPKVELFARSAAPGWTLWGNQAPKEASL